MAGRVSEEQLDAFLEEALLLDSSDDDGGERPPPYLPPPAENPAPPPPPRPVPSPLSSESRLAALRRQEEAFQAARRHAAQERPAHLARAFHAMFGGCYLAGHLGVRSSRGWLSRSRQRWVVLKDSMLTLHDDEHDAVARGALLFGLDFSISDEEADLAVRTSFETWWLSAPDAETREQWADALRHAIRHSVWTRRSPHGSFAPVRHSADARWLIDGRATFEAIARAIEQARGEILIADWWLAPEVTVLRPSAADADRGRWLRLEQLLQARAEAGVNIFVLLFKEVELALPINSAYSKRRLRALHPNIRVVRHPRRGVQQQDALYWSHHEKLVVVDRTVAFLGGIDLCFGRDDDARHALADPAGLTWPGVEFYNPRIADHTRASLERVHEDLLDRERDPRMPWHDVHVSVTGLAARDVARHFIARWNHVRADKGYADDRLPLLLPLTQTEGGWASGDAEAGAEADWWANPNPPAAPAPAPTGDFERALHGQAPPQGTCAVQLLRSVTEWSAGVSTESSIAAAYEAAIAAAERFIYVENQFFTTMGTGPDVRNGVGAALLARISRAIAADETFRVVVVLPARPAFEGDFHESNAIRNIAHFQLAGIRELRRQLEMAHPGCDVFAYLSFYCLRTHAVLGGVVQAEQVYVHSKLLIVDDRVAIIGSANINDRSLLGDRDSELALLVRDAAPVHITMDGEPFVASRFAHTLRCRLWREHLGLLPCQQSVPAAAPVLSTFGGLQAQAGASGRDMLAEIAQLQQRVVQNPTPERVEAVLNQYRTAGRRLSADSPEYEALLKDMSAFLQSSEGGGRAAAAEEGAFGLPPAAEVSVVDPICHDTFGRVWRRTADLNTAFFGQYFPHLPRNSIRTLAEFARLNAEAMQPVAPVDDSEVRGHLVHFPVDFLRDEDLSRRGVTDAEYYVGREVFT